MISPGWQKLEQAFADKAALDKAALDKPALEQKGEFPRQAAVMLLLTDAPEPELIYTLRAKHLSHHAGEVCFPGGMWEPQDPSLLTSALRETHEEIGVHPSLVKLLGSLSPRETRAGTQVRPFVGRIAAETKFILNHHELDDLFKIPLAAFKQGLQVRTDVFERNGIRLRIPVYVYEGYTIWGFTAAVTAELLNLLE